MKTVAIAGTFDSKGEEFLYIKNLFESLGIHTFTIHTGVFEPLFEPDVSNEAVMQAAGRNLREIAAKKDRALATEILSEGVKTLIPRLYEEGKFDGIISLGGSGGTSLATAAMRALPIGVPKLMVSTMASGNVEKYIGTSDIIMMPSIVDVSGINRLSETIFGNAVSAMAGMLTHERKLKNESRPLVAATMFGVTTPCIDAAKAYLERNGYEVLVFHCTGTGGKTMEALASSGFFKGILDLTTTEWCDELVGGDLRAGRTRCEAAAKAGIPQVVSIGALDMVNFGPMDTIDERFEGRKFYKHNPMVTLMRTTEAECTQIAHHLAEKWNMAKPDKIAVMLPLKGVSMIDAEGQPFYGPDEDAALCHTLKEELNDSVEVIEMDCNINDAVFAEAAAKKLIELMNQANYTE